MFHKVSVNFVITILPIPLLRLLWQPGIPPGSQPIPWEKSPRGKLSRVLFHVHLEAHEAGISRPNPRGNPRERSLTSGGREFFLSRSAAASRSRNRSRFSLARTTAGAATPPSPARRATAGTPPPARRAPTRGRGGWHRGSWCNDDEAASRQRGHTAPSRRGQGGSKAARLTGRGGAEAQIRLLLLAARRPPAVARLGLCVPL
ncbi:hypothetical protein DAI22_07g045850 [Oryza sativa Japonica Group]|nr:hypothetical protein DAI22_07g045850 [Oryza sativa Japonica Group]